MEEWNLRGFDGGHPGTVGMAARVRTRPASFGWASVAF